MMKSDERQKRSFIAGGLISTAGIFFAKFLGLFYAVPFNSILGGGANIAIYGVAYNIYNYVLNICLAGVPFAICFSRGLSNSHHGEKAFYDFYDRFRCFGNVIYDRMCRTLCVNAIAKRRCRCQ